MCEPKMFFHFSRSHSKHAWNRKLKFPKGMAAFTPLQERPLAMASMCAPLVFFDDTCLESKSQILLRYCGICPLKGRPLAPASLPAPTCFFAFWCSLKTFLNQTFQKNYTTMGFGPLQDRLLAPALQNTLYPPQCNWGHTCDTFSYSGGNIFRRVTEGIQVSLLGVTIKSLIRRDILRRVPVSRRVAPSATVVGISFAV